jgi:hypothetical protein
VLTLGDFYELIESVAGYACLAVVAIPAIIGVVIVYWGDHSRNIRDARRGFEILPTKPPDEPPSPP